MSDMNWSRAMTDVVDSLRSLSHSTEDGALDIERGLYAVANSIERLARAIDHRTPPDSESETEKTPQ